MCPLPSRALIAVMSSAARKSDEPWEELAVRTSPVKIRRLAASEWKQFRKLRLNALQTDPLAFGSNFQREKAYPADRWRKWAKSGTLGDETATFVIEARSGLLVGMAGVFTDRDEYHLWGMWVSPEFRDRGLGRKLLDQVLSWTQSTNPSREVCLDVNPVQTVAVRLYESRGFRSTGKTSPLGHHAPEVVQEMRRIRPTTAVPKTRPRKNPR
jgi:ribosomal protein S18 acetylase RimI-like enzyme